MTESKYLARSTDPGTSQEAAERAVKSGMVAAHCDLIWAALSWKGPQCASELAANTGLLPHQIMKRLSDLGRKQLAAPTGDKIGGQRVWAAMEVQE